MTSCLLCLGSRCDCHQIYPCDMSLHPFSSFIVGDCQVKFLLLSLPSCKLTDALLSSIPLIFSAFHPWTLTTRMIHSIFHTYCPYHVCLLNEHTTTALPTSQSKNSWSQPCIISSCDKISTNQHETVLPLIHQHEIECLIPSLSPNLFFFYHLEFCFSLWLLLFVVL